MSMWSFLAAESLTASLDGPVGLSALQQLKLPWATCRSRSRYAQGSVEEKTRETLVVSQFINRRKHASHAWFDHSFHFTFLNRIFRGTIVLSRNVSESHCLQVFACATRTQLLAAKFGSFWMNSPLDPHHLKLKLRVVICARVIATPVDHAERHKQI